MDSLSLGRRPCNPFIGLGAPLLLWAMPLWLIHAQVIKKNVSTKFFHFPCYLYISFRVSTFVVDYVVKKIRNLVCKIKFGWLSRMLHVSEKIFLNLENWQNFKVRWPNRFIFLYKVNNNKSREMTVIQHLKINMNP